MSVLLEARRLTKIFGGGLLRRTETVALENFSLKLDAEKPTITAVVGESGSGKTTLARLLLGIETPTKGAVLYKGKSLQELDRDERHEFRRNVQVVFQDPFEVYNPFYRVDHVLNVPVHKFGLASTNEEAQELVKRALEDVGLRVEDTLGRHPHQLSGGQRQRIMVARALLLQPKLILADEPVSMIDASLRATVLGNLRYLNENLGISLLYITHDLTTAYQISGNIIVMYAGSVMEVGDVELVVQDPKHPYTQLLIGSVPQPDPDLRWSAQALEDHGTGLKVDTARERCRFADRCPYVMKRCGEQLPPLYRVDNHRLAACFLYDDCPEVPAGDMDTAFVTSG